MGFDEVRYEILGTFSVKGVWVCVSDIWWRTLRPVQGQWIILICGLKFLTRHLWCPFWPSNILCPSQVKQWASNFSVNIVINSDLHWIVSEGQFKDHVVFLPCSLQIHSSLNSQGILFSRMVCISIVNVNCFTVVCQGQLLWMCMTCLFCCLVIVQVFVNRRMFFFPFFDKGKRVNSNISWFITVKWFYRSVIWKIIDDNIDAHVTDEAM